MSKLMIDNAIDILNLGIRIKKQQLMCNELNILNLFSVEDIKTFDADKARRVINNLITKRKEIGTNRLTLVKGPQKNK